MRTLIEVATAANGIKKPSKNRAFEIVLELIELSGAPTGEQLAELYSFFLPGIPKKPKTAEQWVAKARAKNDVRAYLNYVYSDGNRLMASDGSRLHICATKLDAGFYDDALSPISLDARFPDVDRIIPKNDGTSVSVEAFAAGFNTMWRLPVYLMPSGDSISKKLLDEAVHGEVVSVLQKGTGSPVRLDFKDFRIAVLMPLRGKNQ